MTLWSIHYGTLDLCNLYSDMEGNHLFMISYSSRVEASYRVHSHPSLHPVFCLFDFVINIVRRIGYHEKVVALHIGVCAGGERLSKESSSTLEGRNGSG